MAFLFVMNSRVMIVKIDEVNRSLGIVLRDEKRESGGSPKLRDKAAVLFIFWEK